MIDQLNEIISRFPDGTKHYNESAIFNSLVKYMWQGMSVEVALIECIKHINKQNEQMQKILNNQPQRIIVEQILVKNEKS